MKVQVCRGKKCDGSFSEYIIKRLENDKEKFNLKNIEISTSSCMGECSKGPNIKIDNEKFYKMNPLKASELIRKKNNKNNENKKYKN